MVIFDRLSILSRGRWLEKRSFKSSFLLWSYTASFAAISWARCTWRTVLDWLTKQSRRARALFQHRGPNSPFFLLLHECKFDMVKMVLRVPRSWNIKKNKENSFKILKFTWTNFDFLTFVFVFHRLFLFYLLLAMSRATKPRGNLWEMMGIISIQISTK